MMFVITITGRRFSDGGEYALKAEIEASTEQEALARLEQDYDWDDAATRVIQVDSRP